jgi:hypothetical protein
MGLIFERLSKYPPTHPPTPNFVKHISTNTLKISTNTYKNKTNYTEIDIS